MSDTVFITILIQIQDRRYSYRDTDTKAARETSIAMDYDTFLSLNLGELAARRADMAKADYVDAMEDAITANESEPTAESQP
jgi:hypothetical protein